jgi:hypothetical protein
MPIPATAYDEKLPRALSGRSSCPNSRLPGWTAHPWRPPELLGTAVKRPTCNGRTEWMSRSTLVTITAQVVPSTGIDDAADPADPVDAAMAGSGGAAGSSTATAARQISSVAPRVSRGPDHPRRLPCRVDAHVRRTGARPAPLRIVGSVSAPQTRPVARESRQRQTPP